MKHFTYKDLLENPREVSDAFSKKGALELTYKDLGDALKQISGVKLNRAVTDKIFLAAFSQARGNKGIAFSVKELLEIGSSVEPDEDGKVTAYVGPVLAGVIVVVALVAGGVTGYLLSDAADDDDGGKTVVIENNGDGDIIIPDGTI